MYSLDFRKQVFKIKEKDNLTFEETADRFGVNIRSLFRWNDRLEPIIKRNVHPRKIDMEKLRKDVEKHPDKYQWERAKAFGVAQSGIFYALRRLGKTYKKNDISSKS